MASTTADERPTANVEGADLLGQPNFTELDNGRFRCVETGHEILAKNRDSYSRTKHCRLGLIDFAMSHQNAPLNMFVQDPLFGSKLICRLTGDTINKTEEHIWKHISGRRFLNRLEQEELEKDSLAKSGKKQGKRKAGKASKSSTKHLKSKKKRQDCDNGGSGMALESVSEPVNDGANTTELKLDPGPSNPTILHLQSTHRSQLVWIDQSANCLHCRRREAILHRTIDLDPRMVPYLKQSGFYPDFGVLRVLDSLN